MLEHISIRPPEASSCFRFYFANLIVVGTRWDVGNK